MNVRSLVLFSALAFAAAGLIMPIPVAAQATKKTDPKSWNAPLAPDGHPDLQGTWMNKGATPLERPKQLEGRQFLTDAEVAELKSRAARIFRDGRSDAANGDAVFLAALANVERYKGNATSGSEFLYEREFDNRTSLIIDPPDGKIPPYTPAGQRRQNALAAATAMRNPPAGPQDLTNFQRCITWGVPLPRPGPFSTYYQIVQNPGYVVFVMEAIHDARIIPVDGRPHLPQAIRTWNGDSIGHWEGKTLVVDTTNFSPKANFMGSAEDLHLVERFTRAAPDEIRYEITVDDLTTWTKPWTAVIRLRETQDRIFEVACHEGNQAIMEDMLSAARVNGKAGEAAAPIRSK